MFLIHKMDTSLTRGIEYVPAENGEMGMILRPEGEGYVMASEDSKPTHLAVGKLGETGNIPAIHLDEQIELETVTEADLTDIALGTLLKTDGNTVTAESGGHASLTYKEKQTDGTWLCRVRFI